jgi:hypothetical protein
MSGLNFVLLGHLLTFSVENFEMDMTRLEVTEVALPFELPDTVAAREWMMELDFVDIYEGSLDELRDMANRAPSPSARFWLKGWIGCREQREAFSGEFRKAA